jgi:hypothetical protein
MSEELISKVKKAIERSGFPLELKITQILSRRHWFNWIGHYFRDYETLKDRELDIKAYKEIRKTAVHLYISCKSTKTKQLVLYTPSIAKPKAYLKNPLLTFPSSRKIHLLHESNPLRNLNLLNPDIPLAHNILLVSGDKVLQNNVELLSSLNGLVKAAIMSASDGYSDTGWRMTFHYILVWDGPIYRMTPSVDNMFKLEEVSHGVLRFHFPLRINSELDSVYHLRVLFFKTGDDHYIEVARPSSFESIINNIEDCLNSCSSTFLSDWGLDVGSM